MQGGVVNILTVLRLRPLRRLLPGSTQSHCPAMPCDLPAGRTMSTPLDYSSVVPLCVVCIEDSRAIEATHQTRDLLCGCDEHIQQLEQHGRAAIRRQRSAVSRGYMDRGAPPARGTTRNRAADSRGQSALVRATGVLANHDAAIDAAGRRLTPTLGRAAGRMTEAHDMKLRTDGIESIGHEMTEGAVDPCLRLAGF